MSELLVAVAVGLFLLCLFLLYLYTSLKGEVPAQLQQQQENWRHEADETLRRVIERRTQEMKRESDESLRRELDRRLQEWRAGELRAVKAEAEKETLEQAQKLFQAWCEREVQKVRDEQRKLAVDTAKITLEEWKSRYEAQFKREVSRKGHAVSVGKAAEHLFPLLPENLAEYNPQDFRFMGSPIDYIIFDGLCEEGSELREIIFVEVKTGKGGLSPRERQVRNAVRDGRIRWIKSHVGDGSAHEYEPEDEVDEEGCLDSAIVDIKAGGVNQLALPEMPVPDTTISVQERARRAAAIARANDFDAKPRD